MTNDRIPLTEVQKRQSNWLSSRPLAKVLEAGLASNRLEMFPPQAQRRLESFGRALKEAGRERWPRGARFLDLALDHGVDAVPVLSRAEASGRRPSLDIGPGDIEVESPNRYSNRSKSRSKAASSGARSATRGRKSDASRSDT